MTDTKFFTNSEADSLLSRFQDSLRYAKSFDVLVGYFRSSGFKLMAEALEEVESIRILVGLNTDAEIVASNQDTLQDDLYDRAYAHSEVAETFRLSLQNEYDQSPDNEDVESSVSIFTDWIKKGKIEIRGHPSRNIHAKLYITRYAPGPSYGSVITGSSNFSLSGLKAQREFNVELKDRSDVDFALNRFEELWAEGVYLNETFLATTSRAT